MNDHGAADSKKTQQQFAVGEDRIPLTVTSYYSESGISLVFSMREERRCILHWGLVAEGVEQWIAPPKHFWPSGSEKFDDLAVRSPFAVTSGVSTIKFHIDSPVKWIAIEFVLYYPDEERYEKNGRYDYHLGLKYVERSDVLPETALKDWLGDAAEAEGNFYKNYHLDTGEDLALCRREVVGGYDVYMVTNIAETVYLHWGVNDRFNSGWKCPPLSLRNKISVVYDDKAVRTAFTQEKGLASLKLSIPGSMADGLEAISFLLYQSDDDEWIKYKGNDLFLPLFIESTSPDFVPQEYVDLLEAIVAGEAGHRSWTLMHRYNLCMDLLAHNTITEWSLMIIFVWLRYSATRQLDWQRNYNTKPRELAHSQKELTYVFARLWKDYPQQRYWIRRIMGTVGRGGDGGQGQMIRDEILNIMHRNHIKETHGHFMEEWHQKLHNNTTPDDVVICQAYLEFLRSNGNVDRFYQVLGESGVTRERLRGYDRPIVSDPDFRGDDKDSLIHDFENYLRILQTVHGGAELSVALSRAQGRLDGALSGGISALINSDYNRLESATGVRRELAGYIERATDDTEILDLVYLDLSLEGLIRRDFESIPQEDYFGLTNVLLFALEQMALAGRYSAELDLAKKHWDRLTATTSDISGLDALEGVTIAERFGRVVQENASEISSYIQPVAEYIGKSCRCDEWSVKLFAEETVRGGESFPLSKVVQVMLKHLRAQAGMGGWQIIGPGSTSGVLQSVKDLHSVESVVYSEPVILMTETVGGDEEVPEGVVGIISRHAPDLVSHLSVRTRNLGVVFGACFEDDQWHKLEELTGESIILSSSPTGGMLFKQGHEDSHKSSLKKIDISKVKVREFSGWAVARKDFTREILGGKSNNLNILLGNLPEWIGLPMSMAVPFGAFEQALQAPENSEYISMYRSMFELLESDTDKHLTDLRNLILQLKEPAGFKDEFMAVWETCGFADISWDEIWSAIRKVWASKWNNRAYYSRKHLGLEHDKLQMAVLVQQVIEADYAFVIHTVNPITGNPDQVFAETVLGLGETLVGNYPGRSLGFTYDKNTEEITILSLPGKSTGLFGGGVIFRSDSNGEDLEGFAGAGLYDSYLAREPESRIIDYTGEKLLLDSDYRLDLCLKIGRIGVEIEKICGFAQDIEGAVHDGRYFVVQNRPQIGL